MTPSSWDEEGEEGRDVDMDEREVRGKWEDERRGDGRRKRIERS